MPRSNPSARRLAKPVDSAPADTPPRKAAFAAFSLAANALSQREHGERDAGLGNDDLLRAASILVAAFADFSSQPRDEVAASVCRGAASGAGSSTPADVAAAFSRLLATPQDADLAKACARTLLSAL